MRVWDAWTFPATEQHLPKRMQKFNIRIDGRLTYQYPLYALAVKHCRQRRVAVDVGAHVGLFSYFMVRDFGQVVAFEPVALHAECWRANVPARPGDVLHQCALGARPGSVRLAPVTESSSGGTAVVGPGDIPLKTLDSFGLPTIDFLKIDCEGYEHEVIAGGVETIARCRPVIAVEQRARLTANFHHGPADAVKALTKLGAKVAWTDRSDYVLVFR
jgi:FkbM family methyltransferase